MMWKHPLWVKCCITIKCVEVNVDVMSWNDDYIMLYNAQYC